MVLRMLYSTFSSLHHLLPARQHGLHAVVLLAVLLLTLSFCCLQDPDEITLPENAAEEVAVEQGRLEDAGLSDRPWH